MITGARTIALAFSVSLLAASAYSTASHAQALQNYVLENIKTQSKDKKSDVFIPRIELEGTNITRSQIEQLLDPDLSTEARAQITSNAQAKRIFAPEIVITRNDKNMGRFVLRDYLATNVDSARFERISLGAIEGTMKTNKQADAKFTSGKITLEGGDFRKVADAAQAGSASDGVAKLGVFNWAGFDMTITDVKTPADAAGGNQFRLGLKSATAQTAYAGDLPTTASAKFSGMYFQAPPASDAGQAMARFGYDRVEFGINFDGVYNPENRSFKLSDYSITGVKAGELALSGAFADVDGATFTGANEKRLSSLMQSKVASVNLRYVDAGLFEKALAYFAASQGKTAAAVRSEWSMMIVGMLPMVMGGDPAAFKLSEALSTFVNQPKSLSISLEGKGGPLGMAELMRLGDPAYFLSKVNITAVANR